jgi:hypothetical protein
MQLEMVKQGFEITDKEWIKNVHFKIKIFVNQIFIVMNNKSKQNNKWGAIIKRTLPRVCQESPGY